MKHRVTEDTEFRYGSAGKMMNMHQATSGKSVLCSRDSVEPKEMRAAACDNGSRHQTAGVELVFK